MAVECGGQVVLLERRNRSGCQCRTRRLLFQDCSTTCGAVSCPFATPTKEYEDLRIGAEGLAGHVRALDFVPAPTQKNILINFLTTLATIPCTLVWRGGFDSVNLVAHG
jgi:hypothetical protein